MATEMSARRVFVGLIVVSIVLVGLVVAPFAKAFFLAAVLAGALTGLHERLARRLRGHRSLAAGVLCVAVVVALLLPLGSLTAYVITELVGGVQLVLDTLNREGVPGVVERLPDWLQGPATSLLAGLQVRGAELLTFLQEQLTARGGSAARAVTGVVAATGSIALQLVLMLIAFYFLLVDGQLVEWTESVSPLKRGQTTEILREFRRVTRSVMVSSLVTAGVQALAALVGYFIARVPSPLFFGAVTFFIALIPAVGAAVVCLAAALLLLLMGHPWAALFLAIWGLGVVGTVDNVVKPLLVKRGMHMHGALVFFSLLGGLAAFGTIGLLVGPLVVALFLALVRIYERDYGRPSPRPGDPGTPPAEEPVTPRSEPAKVPGRKVEAPGRPVEA
jgi:predicted PurR-regulated permease PerM